MECYNMKNCSTVKNFHVLYCSKMHLEPNWNLSKTSNTWVEVFSSYLIDSRNLYECSTIRYWFHCLHFDAMFIEIFVKFYWASNWVIVNHMRQTVKEFNCVYATAKHANCLFVQNKLLLKYLLVSFCRFILSLSLILLAILSFLSLYLPSVLSHVAAV